MANLGPWTNSLRLNPNDETKLYVGHCIGDDRLTEIDLKTGKIRIVAEKAGWPLEYVIGSGTTAADAAVHYDQSCGGEGALRGGQDALPAADRQKVAPPLRAAYCPASFLRSRSPTCCGLALPLLAFMA